MVVNKSCISKARRDLLRVMFEGHGFSLEQLETVSRISQLELENWCQEDGWEAGCCVLLQTGSIPQEDAEISNSLPVERDALAKSMAKASVFLRQSLDKQVSHKHDQSRHANTEGRVKEIVSITKAIQVLEGLIINMEQPKDEASQYPQDTLEFHRILKKQIKNLTNTRPEKSVS